MLFSKGFYNILETGILWFPSNNLSHLLVRIPKPCGRKGLKFPWLGALLIHIEFFLHSCTVNAIVHVFFHGSLEQLFLQKYLEYQRSLIYDVSNICPRVIKAKMSFTCHVIFLSIFFYVIALGTSLLGLYLGEKVINSWLLLRCNVYINIFSYGYNPFFHSHL